MVDPLPPADRFSRPLLGVLALVEGPDDEIALVLQQRGPYAGHWILPGGGVEFGETAADTFVREVREETGLELNGPPRAFATYELRGQWTHGAYHLVLIAFHARTSQRIAEGFDGHNVGGVRQVLPRNFPLHSTDLRILTDAGLCAFDEHTIAAALAKDGIDLRRY